MMESSVSDANNISNQTVDDGANEEDTATRLWSVGQRCGNNDAVTNDTATVSITKCHDIDYQMDVSAAHAHEQATLIASESEKVLEHINSLEADDSFEFSQDDERHPHPHLHRHCFDDDDDDDEQHALESSYEGFPAEGEEDPDSSLGIIYDYGTIPVVTGDGDGGAGSYDDDGGGGGVGGAARDSNCRRREDDAGADVHEKVTSAAAADDDDETLQASVVEMTVSNGDADLATTDSPHPHLQPLPPPPPPPQTAPTLIHPCVDPPLCPNCTRLELSFFDPACPGCRDILVNPATSVPEIFAILRQWTPQTQQSIELLVDQILKRGANINDRDGLTDMTLLHYASKSGAAGIGDPEVAKAIVAMLIEAGADANIRCRWTNMAALHYAAYFDVVPVLRVLLKATKALVESCPVPSEWGKDLRVLPKATKTLDIDSTCSEFEHGTALHIAASNLAYDACKILLQSGGSPALKDDLGRRPVDCVPDPETFEDPELSLLVAKLKAILSEALPSSPKPLPVNYDLVQSKVTLQALGLTLGDKIMVGGVKSGSLRYCGPAEFATGIWAGIELDEPAGKNNGSVGGICYFTCADNHGIFAPISKVTKLGVVARCSTPPAPRRYSGYTGRDMTGVDVSRVTAKVDTGLTKQPSIEHGFEINDRVIVAGQRKGTVRYIGDTQFAPGLWFGVELDRTAGKNNGSVSGVTYFSCKPKYGVFAPATRIQKLGDKRFSSSESLDTISWGAVSERVERRPASGLSTGRSRTPTRGNKSHLDLSRVPGKGPGQVLEVGVTVLCNNELGVIRYMGSTEFGEGTWLGVELRKPKGKNDGSVQGTRYFTCAPDHGLLVKPSRVTVRGINGAKLLAEQNAMGKTQQQQQQPSHPGSSSNGSSHTNHNHNNNGNNNSNNNNGYKVGSHINGKS